MARTSSYLNFKRVTEAAFLFYQSVFGGEFVGGISRFSSMPPQADGPQLSADDLGLIMHVELQILGGHALMGTDAPESMGFKLKPLLRRDGLRFRNPGNLDRCAIQ